MEFFLIILGLGLIFGVIVLPLIAFAKASSACRQVESLAAKLQVAETLAHRAEQHAAHVDQRLSQFIAHQEATRAPGPSAFTPPPTAPASVSTPTSAPAPTPTPTPTPAPAPAPADPLTASPSPRPDAATFDRGRRPPRSTPTEPTVRPPFDWEGLVGVRLFAWLGGGALFLAAALFFHYSIQQDLIPPAVRVAGGLVFGAVALFGGDRLRARTPLAADAISGAGVAILYAALFAARSLYELIDSAPAFAGMSLVTVTAGVVAVRRNAYFVALLGLLGGLSTPYLLSTGQDRPIALLLYVTLLSTGISFVGARKDWPSLGLIGFTGSSVLFVGWSARYLDAGRTIYALLAFTFVAAIYGLWRFPRATAPLAPKPLTRALGAIAILAPFVAAMALGAKKSLDLHPLALSIHLIIVSALSVFVGRRHDLSKLAPLAAALCVAAWLLRIDSQLFPDEELVSYASMTLVPLAYFAVWMSRKKRERTEFQVALLIVLCGSAPLVVAARLAQFHPGAVTWTVAYAALHAVLLVVVGSRSKHGLPVILAEVVMLVALVAGGSSLPSGTNQEFRFAIIASGLVFYALPLALPRLASDAIGWCAGALALPLHFLLLYAFARGDWGAEVLGIIALLAGGLSVLALIAVRSRPLPKGLGLRRFQALFGGIALSFLTAAIPILLSNEWLTLSWALEVLAIAWLYRRVPEPALLWFASVLAFGVSARLLLNPAIWTYYPRTDTRILNHYLYTFGVPAAAFFSAARLLRGDELAARYRMPPALGTLGTLFLFFLLNIEIADYFSEGPTLAFRFAGGRSLVEDMTYSLGWGGFGIGLLVAGIVLKQRPARIGALAVVLLTIGKVFLHDLWALGSLYRVGSIVGLAIALLGVSYLTQRFILQKERA